MKTCSKCKETKELTEFKKNKAMLDGLHSHCRKCDCNQRALCRYNKKNNILKYIKCNENEKQCRSCKEIKEVTEFYKDRKFKDGLSSICKICNYKKSRIYIENNKEKVSKRKKQYSVKNKAKIKANQKIWYNNNKHKHRNTCAIYAEKNKEKILEYTKKWREKNKERLNDYYLIYRKNNIEKYRITKKLYAEKNKEKLNEYHKTWYNNNKDRQSNIRKERRKNDELYVIKCRVSTLIRMKIKQNGYTKQSRTYEILGCSFEDFKLHIERQFAKGMSWDNRDKWHIDHIIPMATAKTEEDVIRLNHYTNLRPLWAEENLSKSDKIITHQLVLL